MPDSLVFPSNLSACEIGNELDTEVVDYARQAEMLGVLGPALGGSFTRSG